MFRCPNCAKTHKVHVTAGYSILANENMDTFWMVREPFYQGDLLQAFRNMIKKVDVLPKTVLKCACCGHTDDTENFEDAFQNPMDYFDAEQLCSCGEELWMDKVPGSNRFAMICDKCGWIKPNSVVSGSEDTTVR